MRKVNTEIEADDLACEAAIEKVMAGFGERVQRSLDVRRAAGIPDPIIDLSPERQAFVLENIKKEMDRLRPLKERLLRGVQSAATSTN